MKPAAVFNLLLKNFPFEPTNAQKHAFAGLSEFITENTAYKCFLLKGYAGTGKTTVINAMIKTLYHYDFRVIMLAPTGRAAKVINHYTGDDASTIHRYLYEIKSDKNGDIKTKVKPNKFKKQIFIIDESSMISNEDDKTLFKGASLLSDLVDHVYSQADNAIVFIGDTAQLPPVGLQCSPALDQNFLQNNCQLQVRQYELKEVVRQQLHSGILANAHCTRLLLEREEHFPRLKTSGFDDVNQVTSAELSEALSGYFPSGDDNTVTVLCRSNKQANRYNEFIRKTFYGFEDVVEKNERLMVVKNNYYWHESDNDNAFIANGDEIKLIRLKKQEEYFGFRFANATIELSDEKSTRLEVKLLLDTLNSESPALTYDEYKKLFDEVRNHYRKTDGKVNMRKLREDPYLNALQVKYAYAITGHKAQGGQWETVFIDPGFMTEEMYGVDYMRWLYTAITRARKKVYLINVPDRFFVQ